MDIRLNNWNNVVLVGDTVLSFVLRKSIKVPIEFYIYGLSKKDTMNRIKELLDELKTIYGFFLIVIKDDRIECISENKCIIIYISINDTINSILESIKIDCRCTAFNGKNIYTNERFDNAIKNRENNLYDKISTEDFIRMIKYRKFGIKMKTNPIFSLIDNNYCDVLLMLTIYYKTLIHNPIIISSLSNCSSKIQYYYDKIDYNKLYKNKSYNRIITSDEIEYVAKWFDGFTSSCIEYTVTPICNNILTDEEIDDILNDKIHNIHSIKYDQTGRSSIYLALLFNSYKTAIYLYNNEFTDYDRYLNTDITHIICQNGLKNYTSIISNNKHYLTNDSFGLPAYIYMIIFNRLDIFKEIIPEIEEYVDYRKLLKLSIILKRFNFVKFILDKGIHVDCLLSNEYPIHLSIKHTSIDIFKLLINKGGNIYAQDNNKLSSIRLTIKMLNKNNDQQLLKILDMLLEDIDIKNDFFVEELLSCTDTKLIDHIIPRYQDIISYKYNNKTIMDLVLEKINMLKCSVHSNGFIESESTIKTNITTKKEIEYLNYFRKILEINISQKDKYTVIDNKITAHDFYYMLFNGEIKSSNEDYNMYCELFLSVWENDLNKFKSVLLENNLDMDVYATNTKRTLLHVCMEKDSYKIFKFIIYLIESTINDNNKSYVYLKNFFIKNNLINYGIKHDARNCLDFLLTSKSENIIKLIKECFAKNDNFIENSAINENIEMLSYLLRNEIIHELPSNIYTIRALWKLDVKYNNIMDSCIKNNCVKSIYFFLKKLNTYNIDNVCAEIFLPSYANRLGHNYMHKICMHGDDKNLNLVKLFNQLDNTLINIKDNSGKTPLYYSCSLGNTKTMSLLIQLGSQTDIFDNKGWAPIHEYVLHSINDSFIFDDIEKKTQYEKYTPLMIAAKYNNVEGVEYLLSKSVNKLAVDILGNTYMHYLMYNCDTYIDNIDIVCIENNFGITPIECLKTKIKKELAIGNLENVSSLVTLYNKYIKKETGDRIMCKSKNIKKMKDNLRILVESEKTINLSELSFKL
jgi:ankyrin repeat protein